MARQTVRVIPNVLKQLGFVRKPTEAQVEEEAQTGSAEFLQRLLGLPEEIGGIEPSIGEIRGQQVNIPGLPGEPTTEALTELQRTPGGLDLFQKLATAATRAPTAGAKPQIAEDIEGFKRFVGTGKRVFPGVIAPTKEGKNLVGQEVADTLRGMNLDPTTEEGVSGENVTLAQQLINKRKVAVSAATGLEATKARLGVTGKPSETAGKQAGIQVARENIAEINNLLFPGGTFDRGVAATMNVPGTKGLPFTKGRDAKLYIADTVNARIRLESGAAVKEEELKEITGRFTPSIFDSDATAKKRIDLLDKFLDKADQILDPSGLFDSDKFDQIFPDPDALFNKPISELTDKEFDLRLKRAREAAGGDR